MKFNKISILFLAFFACSLIPAEASFAKQNQFMATVVGVTDGDTITVLTKNHRQKKIRLAGIDAPERSQPYGQQSKQTLSDLIYMKQVRVINLGKDKYSRMIATLYLESDDVNLMMVQSGAAWVYTHYAHSPEYLNAEETAHDEQRGLWSLQSDQIVAPWLWRRQKH